jgi:hypothetical protein
MNHHDALEALALEAFTYAYPLHEMTRMRAATSPRRLPGMGFAGDGADSTQRWCNTFIAARQLLGAGGSRVVTPNNDTLYLNAWLDLGPGPLVIDVPDTDDRYHVLGLLDFYTNPFAHLGTRLTGNGARSFVVLGPEAPDAPVPGFEAPRAVVRSPTRWVWIIGRILVDGEHELPAVHALQDRFRLRSLADWRAGRDGAPLRFDACCDAKAPLDAAGFVANVNRALRDNPPPADEHERVARFAAVGIGAGCPDEPAPVHAAVMGKAIEQGLRRLQAAGLGDTVHQGWTLPPRLDGSFGHDHLRRATVALKYIGALESAEAVYPMAYADAEGRTLSGAHAYRLHFAPGQLPPVDGFWSLTMYDRRDFMLVPNAIGRYAIGDRTRGLVRGADGSLTIHVQQAPPADAAARANWLPAPAGEFYLCLRAYLPQPALLDGTYRLPGLQRAAPA